MHPGDNIVVLFWFNKFHIHSLGVTDYRQQINLIPKQTSTIMAHASLQIILGEIS